ncbi:hypothetical protein PV396_42650 [Streptomyces sp. ME02-8801-2C]|uniref:hypothetical protein n=1 Tax=Streptomyces sp. ME02-8801-2C TaxID=3028680 RepID=UPI0029ABBDCE|nr:hypothetical protein [Streptomyces sp. ME02-8801-2C]MDX3458563.1 hypothetical protein [Streptomyces sp. ME02-8801-2C]
MDIELTDDEHLRALAALEAIVGNNDDALTVLAGSDGERPLPVLLAAYGQHTLHRILIAGFGIDATMDYDETGQLVGEINSDPMARIVFVLTDALHNQAAPADDDPATAKLIARSVLLAIHAFTDADNQDAGRIVERLALLGEGILVLLVELVTVEPGLRTGPRSRSPGPRHRAWP